MKKNVLVIGGSYFSGRIFSINASRGATLALYVVNRGKYRLNLPGVSEYQCDRHDTDKLSQILPDITYDAIIDFCGYNPKDIRSIVNILSGKIRQYIFISTSSVYTSKGIKKEGDPTLAVSNNTSERTVEYLSNKMVLEHELKDTCEKDKIPYTIVRPCFIYGPYNYAPRESYFIEKIVKGIPVPEPDDAHAKFSMVYVLDVVRALETVIGDKRAFNEIFNLAGAEQITYKILFSEFECCNEAAFSRIPMTVSQIKAENIQLLFPLDKDDLCSGEKIIQAFGFQYTPFAEGMRKTFAAFKSIYSS